MANTKISDLTLKTGNMEASDLVEITEGGNTTKSVTGTKIIDMVTSSAVVTANTAKISYPSSDSTKLAGIEANATADQTDAEIRAAVDAATNSNVFTDADHSKLDGIESSADVTDTVNVTAAGALMDSELTDLSGVKAVTISTLQVKPSEGAFANGDKTKLDGIEDSATADQTDAEIRTAVEAATDSNVFTDADHSKLNGIEASADVTDSTNVVAALTAGTGITIEANGTIAASPLALTTVQVAANESAQLALTAQEGDVVVRSDESKSYMHNGGTAGTMADYTLLATPADAVLSVNGNTGAITADQIAAAVEAATGSNTFTDADHSKLNAIEASADVTDTTNVTAAGALMDSEVTNLAQVKAFDSADYATAAQGTTADAALPKSGGAMTGAITTNSTFDGRDVATDGTKLDGIETGADVTDATNVASAGAAMLTGATFTGDITLGSSNNITLGSGVKLKESGHRADLLLIESQTSSWGGIQIDNTANETLWNFMANGTTAGIYDDTSNAWMTQWIDGSETRLYFAGSEKFNTLTGGAHITGTLTASGNVTAYSSDERLKDAVPLTDCMSAVNQWEVIRYKWNEKAKKLDEVFEKADDYEVGLSAQSVQRTHPELVSLAPFDRSREDGSSVSGENYITMDYSRAVSVVAGALQEKDQEIQELKEQVAELIKLVKK